MYVSFFVTWWHLERIKCLLTQRAYSDMTPGTWAHCFDANFSLTNDFFASIERHIFDSRRKVAD